jgi:hypothetical protein
MCQALGIVPIDVSRIKLSWYRIFEYILHQEVQRLDYIVNDPRGCLFEDYVRSPNIPHTVQVEYSTLGNPGAFDGVTMRLIDPHHHTRCVRNRDIRHVAQQDIYISTAVGYVCADYIGQYVVCIRKYPNGTVDAPVTAGVVCILSF